VLAWKTAGWIGLDRWRLPPVGTPWRPGGLLEAHVTTVKPIATR
jgi:thiosulfate dehydrogenase [quinone] large subunit